MAVASDIGGGDPSAAASPTTDNGSVPADNTTPTVSFTTADGQTFTAQVPGYKSLSREDQDAVHQAIVDHALGNSSSPGPSTAIPPDTSYSGALVDGLHNAAEGFGKTAELIGNATGWQAASTFGKSLENSVGIPANYQPTNEGAALKSGDAATFVHDLPRAAVEGAADLAAYLGAGAIAGPAGVIGVAAGRNLGTNVAARAVNNNDASPTLGDWIGGGLTTAGQAGLAAVGIGRAGPGAALLEASPALAKPLVAGGLDAPAAAASDAVGQVGNSIGTDKGVQFDPYQALASGAQAGVGRLVSTAPELASLGIKSGTDSVMASLQPAPASPEDAASISRVFTDYQAAQAAAQRARGDASPIAILNSLKSEYIGRAMDTISALRDAGMVSPPQARTLTSVFRDQALRANNTITQGDGGYSTLFDRINDLDLPDQAVTMLQNAARDLNTVSTQSFQNRSVGPFQALGKAAAVGAGIGAAVLSHNPIAAAGIALGHRSVSPIGGAVGAVLDRAFGTNTPTLLLRASNAQAMLDQLGIPAGPSSLSGLTDLQATAANTPRPAIPTPDIATLAQRRLNSTALQNAVKLASAQLSPSAHPQVGPVAADAAVNQALARAALVTKAAGYDPDTGLKADPIPVNVPLGANNRPLTAIAPRKPLGSPQAAPIVPPVQPPQEALRPTSASLPDRPIPAWASTVPTYVQNAVVQRTGRPTTMAEYQKAVDGSAHLTDDQKALYRSGYPSLLPEHAAPLIDALAGGPRDRAGTSPVFIPTDPTVARPLAYTLATQRNYALADQEASRARAAGLPATADAVLQVSAAHGDSPQATKAAKLKVRDAHLAGIADEAARRVAARHFIKPLMIHGTRHRAGRKKD